MSINKNDVISGFPIKVMRDFLRIHGEYFSKDTFREFCVKIIRKKKNFHLQNIIPISNIELLKQEEFIESYPSSGEYFRIRSPLGYRLRTKNLLNPLKREKALNILDDFLKRVELANQNREYLHNIVYVGLFGSLTEEDMEYVY